MDPNAALALLRERMADLTRLIDSTDERADGWRAEADTLARHASDAVDAFAALDAWMARGGFLPDAWHRAPTAKPHVDGGCHDCIHYAHDGPCAGGDDPCPCGREYDCPLCGQRITDGKPCGCGARKAKTWHGESREERAS